MICIKQMTASQSYDPEAKATVQHVYGLSYEGNVFEWDWVEGVWRPWVEKKPRDTE